MPWVNGPGKYDEFTCAELQHILAGLMVAERSLLKNSPIIQPMITECSNHLDKVIRELEQNGT